MKVEWQGLHRVISGGQTGADQGGLLAGKLMNIRTGGTAPQNWETSRGPNPLLAAFGLVPEGTLKTRTIANIKNSDGTVLCCLNLTSPGSKLTRNQCLLLNKPVIDINLAKAEFVFDDKEALYQELEYQANLLFDFITKNEIRVLNVAGNREQGQGTMVHDLTQYIVQAALQLLDLEWKLLRV